MKRKFRPSTAIALGVFAAVMFALAAWGDHLHMNQDVLTGIRTAAAVLGGAGLAAMRSLLGKDDNANGVPDVLEK